MMSLVLRSKLRMIADILLRVPPLFMMDSVLNKSFLQFLFPEDMSVLSTAFSIWLFISAGSFCWAILLFCLGTRQLLEVYNYLMSMAILCVSAWWNLRYMLESRMAISDEAGVTSSISPVSEESGNFAVNVGVQLSLALLFVLLRMQGPFFRLLKNSRVGVSMLQGSVYISLTLPIICGADIGLSLHLPLLAVGIPTLYMITELYFYWPSIINGLCRGYVVTSQAIRTFGIQAFIEGQWIRLSVPMVLQTFWLTRFAYHVVFYGSFALYESYLKTGVVEYFNSDIWAAVGKLVMVRGCETMVALLGLTSVVSYVTHYLGIFMAFCIGSNNEEDKNMGTVSAILFFILALQTGITGLEPEKRLIRLYRNLCLLFTALLHFIHSMVNPLLLSLSASRNLSVRRHSRVLAMCLFLVVFPSWLLVYLWTNHGVSTWLLAVTAFSIEVMIKVGISLMVYLLFMIDAYRDTFWEKLDDYVYYVKSTGSTIEFLFGIFLFGNGAWIMLFESGGTIRAIMMCIHAYFNIWLQARKGWQIFMKRRTAVAKINSLPDATSEQLERVNDICAICYCELNSARITRCHHYFHGVCLRKWLYVQDRCPLCHELIYAPEQPQDSENDASDQNNGNVNNGNVNNGARADSPDHHDNVPVDGEVQAF